LRDDKDLCPSHEPFLPFLARIYKHYSSQKLYELY
jgi:hypothetical protein